MKRWLKFCGTVWCIAASLAAQTRVQQRRADGAMTPLMVYSPAVTSAGCAPLALISHGAGGSERGYEYLAKGLQAQGWLAIVMGHQESGRGALMEDIQRNANLRRDGIQELVMTPAAYVRRLEDIGAALAWEKAQCKAPGGPPFRALLGHSMGGITVMLEAGATNAIGVGAPPSRQDRFDAYVSISTQGSGKVFGANAWTSIRKPMFVLTGTRDGDWAWRKSPYDQIPRDGVRNCHWAGVIDGATHMNFAGRGPGANEVDALAVPAIVSFLQGARSAHCILPQRQAGISLEGK